MVEVEIRKYFVRKTTLKHCILTHSKVMVDVGSPKLKRAEKFEPVLEFFRGRLLCPSPVSLTSCLSLTFKLTPRFFSIFHK